MISEGGREGGVRGNDRKLICRRELERRDDVRNRSPPEATNSKRQESFGGQDLKSGEDWGGGGCTSLFRGGPGGSSASLGRRLRGGPPGGGWHYKHGNAPLLVTTARLGGHMGNARVRAGGALGWAGSGHHGAWVSSHVMGPLFVYVPRVCDIQILFRFHLILHKHPWWRVRHGSTGTPPATLLRNGGEK